MIAKSREYDKEVVKKLGLVTKSHPNPYYIGWVTFTRHVRVAEQCNILLSIIKFNDVVTYDVVDMNACHILLGRPWKFDNNACYHGKSNVYEVEKGGKKFTEGPIQPKSSRGELKEKKTLTILIKEEFGKLSLEDKFVSRE